MKSKTSTYKTGKSRRIVRVILLIFGGMLFVAANVLLTGNVNASQSPKTGTQTAIPSPTPTFDVARLASPSVPEFPKQVDEGETIFWGVCIACHGDRGQGLTDEWRVGAYKEDSNCWQSNCHGSDHPEWGFQIPKNLVFPPLGTPSALGRFENAQQLYDYILVMMPWWNPRSLTSEKAWQLTAYVLKLKGSLPDGLELNGTNASAVPVHRYIAPPKNPNSAIFLFVGIVALAGIGFIVRDFRSLRKDDPDSTPKADPVPRPGFIAHLHPSIIPAQQARWRYTLGAGGMAVFLCLVLVLTGLLEMFYYVPTPEKAAISVETIVNFVPLGAFVRNLHYWAAQMLVAVALIHLARVIFTGAYGEKRKFNFLLGLSLFVFVVLLDFTGYILRWDEGIRWALTAGTNLLKSIPWFGEGLYVFIVGGREPGPAALVRFYSWHIFVLSLIGGFFMIWHLFRVRRDGGIATAPVRENTNRISRADLLKREVLGMLIGGIALALVAVFFPAPISSPIRGDTILAADAKAPWFFLWVQQLLKSGDPFLLGVLLPLGVAGFLGAFPYIFTGIKKDELGRWFPRSGQRAQLIFIIITVIIVALTILAALSSS
ncbi:MAG: cytochrome bc complex cytochrome b subunit [Chloroflexi bacterium]|nr:cytochrome bc complex cytochrome b subunit [Chloroflexota bacterium]